MSFNALSPLDGRYAETLNDLRQHFSESALMRHRLQVEIHWLIHLCQHSAIASIPSLDPKAEQKLRAFAEDFDEKSMERIKAIEASTHHDVKAVEYYLRECIEKEKTLKHLSVWIHFAATSEDINNLAYMGMTQNAVKNTLIPTLQTLYQSLRKLSLEHQGQPMLARTHGQAASPTTFGKEMAVFAWRLHKAATPLLNWQGTGKFSGAVGNYNAHKAAFEQVDWCSISAQLVHDLGLVWQPLTTQIEPHDSLASLFHHLTEVNNVLLDASCDIWHYISLHYLNQKKLNDDQVGSSTMPHKINPIQFENAEGNLGLANALLGFMANKLPISRLQRDLSDSTVMRNIGTAFGHGLLAYQSLLKGLSLISPNTDAMAKDLDQHWEVLTEAAQTLLRATGQDNAYEALKAMSQGKQLTEEDWISWIEGQDFDAALKEKLLAMSPENYTGLANSLVHFLPGEL